MTTADEHKALGNAALQSGNTTEAIEQYTHAIRLDGANHVYYSNRSAAYLKKGDAPNALEDANACLALNAAFPKGYSRKGAALHALKRYNDSIKAYEEGLSAFPEDAGLKKGKADVQREKDGPPPGMNMGGGMAGMGGMGAGMAGLFGPDTVAKMAMHPQLRHYLADQDVMNKIQLIQKNPSLAGTMLSDPKIMDILSHLLGIGGAGGGDDDDEDDNAMKTDPPASRSATSSSSPQPMETEPAAKEPVKKEEDLSHLTPEERKIHENKQLAVAKKTEGNDLYKAKKFDEALAAYDEAIALDPTNMTFLNNKAAVYFTRKDYKVCIETCLQAVEVGKANQGPFEDRSKAYTRAAKAYQKQGELGLAVEMCNKAQLESFDKTTQRLLKTIELEKKKADTAAYLSDEKAEEAKQRGNEQFRNKAWPQAVAEYEEAVKRAPKNAAIRNNLAAALCKIMDFSGATRNIEKAIELDPQYVKAWARKGDIEMLRKDFHKAKESYEKGMTLDPSNAACREGYGKVMEAINYGRKNMTDDEKQQQAAQAMQDPEIQAILQDPVTQQVLKDLKENPAAGQQALNDPMVRAKFEKLIAAGIVETR